MIVYENDCVDCGLPCFSSCKYLSSPHYYCDECGKEATLYKYDGEQLCLDCISNRLEEIN